MKPKACRACGKEFEPINRMHTKHCIPCLSIIGRQLSTKKLKAASREAKRRLMTRRELLTHVQRAFNQYIRERDAALPCISCGWMGPAQFHAGHYRTVAAAPELRFHEDNCHKQCAQCNNYKSGNLTLYRINLIHRIGAERVDWLEGPHHPKKYTPDELHALKDHYHAKLKSLRQQRKETA